VIVLVGYHINASSYNIYRSVSLAPSMVNFIKRILPDNVVFWF